MYICTCLVLLEKIVTKISFSQQLNNDNQIFLKTNTYLAPTVFE